MDIHKQRKLFKLRVIGCELLSSIHIQEFSWWRTGVLLSDIHRQFNDADRQKDNSEVISGAK